MKLLACALGACVLLSGCESNEQQCLNSERRRFKDADVEFVANLGSRGLQPRENAYWVRYRARNASGVLVQGNILCEKNSEDRWVRDETNELGTLMTVQNAIMQAAGQGKYENDKALSDQLQRNFIGYTQQMANNIVFASAVDLAPYAK